MEVVAFIKTYCRCYRPTIAENTNTSAMPLLCIEVNGNSYYNSHAGPTMILVA